MGERAETTWRRVTRDTSRGVLGGWVTRGVGRVSRMRHA